MPATSVSPKPTTKKTPSEEDVFTEDDFLNALRKVSARKLPAEVQPVKPAKPSKKNKVKRPAQGK